MNRTVPFILALWMSALPLVGCSSNSDLTNTPTGRAKDEQNLVQIKVLQGWRTDLDGKTMDAVKAQMKYPKTAKIDYLPKAEAYYDRLHQVTRVSFYGNARCTGPDSREYVQGYFVTWQYPGDIQQQSHVDALDWTLASLEVFATEQF